MDEERVETAQVPAGEVKEPGVDREKATAFYNQLKSKENFPLGILGGVVAAIVGAILWAIISVFTERQIGWMAVGVGFLVGYAIRLLGRGVAKRFGYIGAVCSLFGCVFGNLLTICGFIARNESVPIVNVVWAVMTHPLATGELLIKTFSPMDILFYGIAIYEGYRFAFRQITEEEISAIKK